MSHRVLACCAQAQYIYLSVVNHQGLAHRDGSKLLAPRSVSHDQRKNPLNISTYNWPCAINLAVTKINRGWQRVRNTMCQKVAPNYIFKKDTVLLFFLKAPVSSVSLRLFTKRTQTRQDWPIGLQGLFGSDFLNLGISNQTIKSWVEIKSWGPVADAHTNGTYRYLNDC